MEFVVALFLNADAISNKISVAVKNCSSAERTVLFQGFKFLRLVICALLENVIFFDGLKILVNDLGSLVVTSAVAPTGVRILFLFSI